MTDTSLHLFNSEWKLFVYILSTWWGDWWDSECCFDEKNLWNCQL